MPSRDQQRAARAYTHIARYLEKDDKNVERPPQDDKTKAKAKKYASMVYAMAPLLQSAGLCQALHFAYSRNHPEQRQLVEDLASQLGYRSPEIKSGEDLLKRARSAELAEYLVLTDEALACIAWYRRLVQGALKIDPSDADGE